MREREMFRCHNWLTCKKTSMHKTGLCVDCRKTKCVQPGCEKKFFSGGKWDLCDLHRRRLRSRKENEWKAAI
jgi:hypothetical protein